MTDILTVTLNPALDMSTAVKSVHPGGKLRCEAPTYDPGGGGINVARAVRLLGGEARAFVAVGGYRGEQLCDLLRREGVPLLAFSVGGETRVSLAVTDQKDGAQYRFVMPGPVWDPALAEAAMEAIGHEISGGILVLSGSQPAGVPDSFPRHLAALVKASEARLILDMSGPALEALVRAEIGVDVLRLDRVESKILAGRVLADVREMAGFAASLVTRDVAKMVVLAMGDKGSVLASSAGVWHACTPKVTVKSKVGAGDSFVGAFTLALTQDEAPEAALCKGVAAASAAVMSHATDLCRASDFHALCGKVTLARL